MSLRKGLAALSRLWMNWPLLGGVVAALLSAKHVWVLLAPVNQAIPVSLVETLSTVPDSLFGVPGAPATATSEHPTVTEPATATKLNDVQLVGVFHRRQKGFAILKTSSGQVVLGVGEKFATGLRLVETHPDYVILERNGTRHRVNLDGPIFESNTSSSASAFSATQSPVHSMTVPPAGRHLLDPLTPEQKMVLQQRELEQGNQP